MTRRVLFAIQNWGLGHASRSLVLIRALIARGDDVTVLMEPGPGMRMLESELGGACAFYPCRDIPKPLGRWRVLFYIRMALAMPRIWLRYKLEHRLADRLVAERGIDLVISDSRFGVWSGAAPSYCITHSLRQIVPGRLRWIELLVEWGQRRLLRHFHKILIPDVAAHGGLSGELGHHCRLDWGAHRLVYIGPLADVARPGFDEDIDCFLSVSGIEPQRTLFEQRVLAALPDLQGRRVVTLGRPDLAGKQWDVAGATVYGYLDRRKQAEMLNRARVIVTRSGYTTVMELATLGKRALLVPTPGQSEQEYLARRHLGLGHACSVTQEQLDIARDLPRAHAAAGLPRMSAAQSAERFIRAVSGATEQTPAAD